VTPEQLFVDSSFGLEIHHAVAEMLPETVSVRVTYSQIALRRAGVFAHLWMPTRWLRKADAEVVLSILLERPLESARFDDELAGRLQEAAEQAA
jgi:hypothetical protein